MRNITTTKEFNEAIAESNTRPVLVDFHASWCGPCKMLAPIVEKIAEKHSGKLDVIKVDADEFQETGAKYGVRGIPTLMIFQNGVPQSTKVGSASFKQLESFIEEFV